MGTATHTPAQGYVVLVVLVAEAEVIYGALAGGVDTKG